jgi:hypothetical protein
MPPVPTCPLVCLALLLAVPLPGAEDASEVYAAVSRSTVVIVRGSEPVNLGSGFVVRPGLVATNAHVVARLRGGSVRVVGQERAYPVAAVLARDETHDLALVAVTGLEAPPLPIATVYQLRIGQRVYAFGSPGFRGHVFEGTFSDGQVSALRAADLQQAAPDILHAEAIQTNVAVTHGSSGGPLVDAQGEVVGITSAAIEAQPGVTVAGLTFAVPVKYLLGLMPDFELAHYRYYARLRLELAQRDGLLPERCDDGMQALHEAAREVYREAHLERVLNAAQDRDDRADMGKLVDQAVERYLAERYLDHGRYDAAIAYLDGIAPMAACSGRSRLITTLRDEAMRRRPADGVPAAVAEPSGTEQTAAVPMAAPREAGR